MAGYISKETIDQINQQCDIVQTVGEYTRLEKRGPNDYWGCCPFHGEKTPSFHVLTDKKMYYCFGCHKGGGIVNFVMEMEKTSYAEALTSLARKNGIQIKYQEGSAPAEFKYDNTAELNVELYERIATMFHYLLMETEQGARAREYIKKRGLSEEIINRFKLGYAPADRYWLKKFLEKKNYSPEFLAKTGLFSKNYPDSAFFSDRLMFPIFNRRGQVVAFGGRVLPPASEKERKYLNSGDLPQFKKRETLYGFNFARDSVRLNKRIIFCEGNMDVIAYHQAGLDYAVATLGTALTDEHIKMIQGFVADGAVYLSFDSDGAGQEATRKAILLCRRYDLSVKVIQLKGGKDPSEILLKYGKENLTAQVNSAILDSDYFLVRLGEKYPVNTSDGLHRAAMEYFQYVEVLQSDIQKESCLAAFCQTFNLKPEAVKRDYINRKQAKEPSAIPVINNQPTSTEKLNLDAQLRGLIAVTTSIDSFKKLSSQLTCDDFSNPAAKRLFKILEDCCNDNSFSVPEILMRCNDSALEQLIADYNSSGVYQNSNVDKIADDTIKMIKRAIIEEKRDRLTKQLYTFKGGNTKEDEEFLNQLLKEKQELDQQVYTLLN